MTWTIKITKHLNGYVLEPDSSTEEPPAVIEIPESDVKTEQLAFRRLCYELKDFFAVYNDKHFNNGQGQFLTIKVDGEE